MIKNQILSDLCIELGVAFTKAGKRFADVSSNGEVAKTDLPTETKVEAKEEPKKTTKKATTKKKTTKKVVKEEPKKDEKTFTVKNPPKGKTEVAIFREQWKQLSTEDQEAYMAGEMNSIGKSLVKESPKKDVEELDDFGDSVDGKQYKADDVRKALQTYSKNHADGVEAGKKEARGILASFGAKKVDDLDASQYEDVIQELS